MSKKHKADTHGFVYSTNPDFKFEEEENESQQTLTPAQQKLKLVLDTKHRAGKTVTLVENFIGTDEDLEKLCKQLKNYCGTGGSSKDGIIIIQGDNREKILQWFLKNSYTQTIKR